jgi:hypothetical protein
MSKSFTEHVSVSTFNIPTFWDVECWNRNMFCKWFWHTTFLAKFPFLKWKQTELQESPCHVRMCAHVCVHVCPFYFLNHKTDFHKTVYEHYSLEETLSSHFWLSYSQ